MAKGNILKEAIADAKAVREVALANAKAALEEAFTPKLQNMLNAKLSEDLDETYYDEDEKDMDEGMGMYDEDEKDMDEMMTYDEDEKEMEEDTMDEEIDLEEILNELELEEGDEEIVDEAKAKDDEEEKVDENFDLDTLLEEINNLEEEKEELDEVQPVVNTTPGSLRGKARRGMRVSSAKKAATTKMERKRPTKNSMSPTIAESANGCKESKTTINKLTKELNESSKALSKVRNELNEVNLLNSKLLYVNRIFKANTLDDGQKLRVVETLDKAGSTKEAKLIYETIKDTFNISKDKKTTSKKSIKENFKGMASKTSGTTQSNARNKAVISESSNMISRFQKLANIKINE